MRHLPVFVDTRRQRIVVSGGGRRATAKLCTLVKTEARLEVFAPAPDPRIQAWAAAGAITVIERRLRAEDLSGARLVYAANGDPPEDARVRRLAQRERVLANVVDDVESAQFISPALVDRSPVMVAVGTQGAAPMLARRIKSEVERLLPVRLGQVAAAAGALRPAVRALLPPARRAEFWSWLLDAAEWEGENRAALASRRTLRGLLDRFAAEPAQPGRVALVGAGPGDPELLTARARRRIEQADVVLHDRLVDPRILDLARREGVVTEVGKTPGGRGWSQAAIHRVMVGHARRGRTVVRLKSGDPSLFGRADEELEALAAAGIAAEMVPGISAASAAASRIGASLTRRGRNAAFTLLSGHDALGYAEHDWRTLARSDAVFAIYMGLRAARFVQGRLLLHGRPASTPVTIAARVSRADERLVSGELGGLDALIAIHAIDGPAIIFVGLAPGPCAAGGRPPAEAAAAVAAPAPAAAEQ